jgi:hypothetical protein
MAALPQRQVPINYKWAWGFFQRKAEKKAAIQDNSFPVCRLRWAGRQRSPAPDDSQLRAAYRVKSKRILEKVKTLALLLVLPASPRRFSR